MAFTRRSFVKGAAGSAAIACLPGCVTTNVATGRTSFTGTYDIEDDIAIGRQEHPKMVEAFGGEYDHRRLQSYVTRIGSALAAHAEYQQFPWTFTLLNSPIVNAFAMPGGFVYVSRGLLALASNEAELAGVVAHEIGHVTARHSAERMAAQQLATFGVIAGAIGAAALGLPREVADFGQSIAGIAIRGYSRNQELESDRLGVRYMTRASYDPGAMVSFLATLREQSQLEAQALGLPVVATPVGGIPEMVADEQDGLLVPERDAGALARALRRLLEDDGLRARMSQSGRKSVQRFDRAVTIPRIAAVFRRSRERGPKLAAEVGG